MCMSSSLHQALMFWQLDGSTKIVEVDDKPFMVNSRMTDGWFYKYGVGLVQFMGIDNMGHSINFLINKKTMWMGWVTLDFVCPSDLQFEDIGQGFKTWK